MAIWKRFATVRRPRVSHDPGDTSAWVEFLRGTGSPTHVKLRKLIRREEPLLTTDVIMMELLAGARSEGRAQELRRFLLGFHHAPVRGLADFEAGAALYRDLRRHGITPRSVNDCMIATIALREACPVLHHHRDFTAIAQRTELQIFA